MGLSVLSSPRRRLLAVASVLLVLVAIAGASYLALGPKASASGSANLTVFTGTASVQHSGDSASTAAATGALLRQGDVLTTGPSTKAAVNFPDGSITRLDSNTRLAISGLAQTGGSWNISINQSLGKSWSNVAHLVGGGSFSASAPNHSTAEVRGTEFAIIIEKDSSGNTVVRVDTYSGELKVTANNQTVTVATGQSTTIGSTGAAPSAAAPISEADKKDSWTVFNITVDTVAGKPTTLNVNQLNQGQTTPPQPGSTVTGSAGPVDLDFALGWPGSTFELIVYDPDGKEYQRIASAKPPIHLLVPAAASGNWTYSVHDVESQPGEVFWVVVAASPSKKTTAPVFLTPTPCTHSVTAGNRDHWTVTTTVPNSTAVATVTASGLAPYMTFTPDGAGGGAIDAAPPANAAAASVQVLFTATANGQPPVQFSCTESVSARPANSSIPVNLSFTGGHPVPVTLTLSPGGVTFNTSGQSAHVFDSLGAGTYTVTVTAPDGYSVSGPSALDATVDGTNTSSALSFAIATGLRISTTSLPDGVQGQPYTAQLAAAGGTPPYSWLAFALPSGLGLDRSSGAISGTPSSSGTSSTAIQVTDAIGNTVTGGPAITIANPPPPPTPAPTPTPTSAPTPTPAPTSAPTPTPTPRPSPPAASYSGSSQGEVGVHYTGQVSGSGGTPPYSYGSAATPATTSTAGLPAGLSLDTASGIVAGTPTAAATGVATAFTVTDAAGLTGSTRATFDIAPAVGFQATNLGNAYAGNSFQFQVGATGGVSPYHFAAATGTTLPAGVTLTDAGLISGSTTAGQAGSTISAPVAVTDALGGTATATLTIPVLSAFTTADCPLRAPASAPAFTTPTGSTSTPAIASVSPNQGAPCGMTNVQLTGTNLGGVSALSFGSAALTAPHGGSYSAQLGWSWFALDNGGMSYMYQQVALPSGSPHLNYWYKPYCHDGYVWDYLEVRVRDAGGSTLATLVPPQNLCPYTGSWTNADFDLTQFAGSNVQLWFGVHGDAYGYPDTSFMFIDDVSITGAPGAVVNGGFEAGDMTGWTVGASPGLDYDSPQRSRGFVPRVTWGFSFTPGGGTTPDTITAVTPPQPAGTVDVLALWSGARTSPANADRFTYGVTAGIDHYALRIEPGRVAAPGATPAVASNQPGILGPLNAGTNNPTALTLYAVDAAGNDLGTQTINDTVTFTGLGAAPNAPTGTDPCAGGAHVGGAPMGSPVSFSHLPLVLPVVTCKAETATLTATAGSPTTIANGSSIVVQTRGDSPVTGTVTVAGSQTVAAGTRVQIAFTGRDRYGNPATGTIGVPHATSPSPAAPYCSPQAALQQPLVLMENGSAALTIPVYGAGTGLTFTASGLYPGANEYGGGTGSTWTPAVPGFTTTPLAASQLILSPPYGSVTAGGSPLGTIYAADIYCNVDTNYTGTVAFVSTDSQFSHGRATFAGGTFSDGTENLYTAGSQTITVTDVLHSSLTTTGHYSVQAGALVTFSSITVPASSMPVGQFTVTVSGAADRWGNPATGSITLTPSGYGNAPVQGCTPGASNSVSASVAVSAGTGHAQATYAQASQPNGWTITGSVGSSSHAVTFGTVAGPAAKFAFPDTIAVQATSTSGAQVGLSAANPVFEIDAVDTNCNLALNYSNAVPVSLTSNDVRWSRSASSPGTGPTAMVYPIQAGAFSSGRYTETPSSTYLWTGGGKTLTATEATQGGLTGTSPTLTVNGSAYPSVLRATPAAPPAAPAPPPVQAATPAVASAARR